ncbi:MAG: hypothetical protein EXR20_07995 [Bacteroidetes bacterium]|nr:hypothetical protein [Bacteroidota bacterium]
MAIFRRKSRFREVKTISLIPYRIVWYLQTGFLFSFWIFYFRAWAELGHPPVSSLDDPKYLGLFLHHVLTWILMLLAFSSFWICCLCLVIKIFFRKFSFFKIDAIIFGITAIITFLTFCSYQMEWFMD